QVDLLRAQVSFTMTRGGDSISLLLNAARQLEPVNPRLARETYLDALMAAMPLLRLAVAAFNDREIPPEQLRWLWLAHIVAGHLWDERTLDTIHHVDM